MEGEPAEPRVRSTRREGRPACACAVLAAARSSGGRSWPPPHAATARLERTVYAMGTQLRLEVEGPSEPALRAATEAAIRESERIEAACSTWRADSAWSRLNAAHGAEVPLDAEWTPPPGHRPRLEPEHRGGVRPGAGHADPRLGPSPGRPRPRLPPSCRRPARPRAPRSSCSTRRGAWPACVIPQAAVEEGGFLKGYALDRMAAVLRRAGVRAALLDFGGQLLAFGRPRAAHARCARRPPSADARARAPRGLAELQRDLRARPSHPRSRHRRPLPGLGQHRGARLRGPGRRRPLHRALRARSRTGPGLGRSPPGRRRLPAARAAPRS